MKKTIRIIQSIIDGSFNSRIKKNILSWLGIERHEEEIRTLHYFLTLFHDAKDIPPAKDQDLRLLQQCDAVLLSIFSKICERNGLCYWLDYGTLLGAYRHGGFIPWDNDTDVVMPRNDYDRLEDTISEELSLYGLTLENMNGRYVLSYNLNETGIFTDIFCMEEFVTSENIYTAIETTKKKRAELSKKINKMLFYDYKKYCRIRDEIFAPDPLGTTKIFYHAISPGAEPDIYDSRDVVPLSKMSFEGYQLNVPNNIEKCLRTCYGDTFMELPKIGPESHLSSNIPLKNIAKYNGVDMNAVYLKLSEINQTII